MPRTSSLSNVFMREALAPIVWFSLRPTWEPAVSRSLRKFGRDDSITAQLTKVGNGGDGSLIAEKDALPFGGLYRVGVEIDDSPLHAWPEFGRIAGMSPHVIGRHEEMGRGVGSCPDDWAASLKPVSASFWRRLEWWAGDVPAGVGGVDYWASRGVWIPAYPGMLAFLESTVSHRSQCDSKRIELEIRKYDSTLDVIKNFKAMVLREAERLGMTGVL
jgi:hypothetical protein